MKSKKLKVVVILLLCIISLLGIFFMFHSGRHQNTPITDFNMTTNNDTTQKEDLDKIKADLAKEAQSSILTINQSSYFILKNQGTAIKGIIRNDFYNNYYLQPSILWLKPNSSGGVDEVVLYDGLTVEGKPILINKSDDFVDMTMSKDEISKELAAKPDRQMYKLDSFAVKNDVVIPTGSHNIRVVYKAYVMQKNKETGQEELMLAGTRLLDTTLKVMDKKEYDEVVSKYSVFSGK